MLTLHQSWQVRKESGWMDAFLRAIGLRSGPVAAPFWVMPAETEQMVDQHAHDLVCPITMSMMVQPTELHGHLFERLYAPIFHAEACLHGICMHVPHWKAWHAADQRADVPLSSEWLLVRYKAFELKAGWRASCSIEHK